MSASSARRKQCRSHSAGEDPALSRARVSRVIEAARAVPRYRESLRERRLVDRSSGGEFTAAVGAVPAISRSGPESYGPSGRNGTPGRGPRCVPGYSGPATLLNRPRWSPEPVPSPP